MRKNKHTLEEIAARVQEKSCPVTESGCRIWLEHVNNNGYGRVHWDGKMVYAHRVAYEYRNGPIPDAMTLDHLCRVRCCVEPNHLEVVSQKVNTLRGLSPSAFNAKKTHCHKGHQFLPENTRTNKAGFRYCLACERAREKKRWAIARAYGWEEEA